MNIQKTLIATVTLLNLGLIAAPNIAMAEPALTLCKTLVGNTEGQAAITKYFVDHNNSDIPAGATVTLTECQQCVLFAGGLVSNSYAFSYMQGGSIVGGGNFNVGGSPENNCGQLPGVKDLGGTVTAVHFNTE
ncbi:MAG: hypothetical protein JSS53_01690 [Proteobacteria bacterium]|nr:hypothetical protein [Pseudomonadota bacterium]